MTIRQIKNFHISFGRHLQEMLTLTDAGQNNPQSRGRKEHRFQLPRNKDGRWKQGGKMERCLFSQNEKREM